MEIKITHEMDINEVRDFMERWSALENYDALDELTAYCGSMYDFEYALDGMDIEDVDSYFADGDYADAVINWLEDIDDESLDESDFDKVCSLLAILGMDDYIDEDWLDKPLTPEEQLIKDYEDEFNRYIEFETFSFEDLGITNSSEYYAELKIQMARYLIDIAMRLGITIDRVNNFQAFVEFARQYAELELADDIADALLDFCAGNKYETVGFM